MKHMYVTVTGTQYHYGTDFLEKGMLLQLEKDPDNQYDTEAIKVTFPGLGTIGHVANSVKTRIGESMSAGRLYDRIGDKAEAKVLLVMPMGVLCEVQQNEEA
ncbi:MAG: HIRAN domain-containing protein [Clostridia bacterium]|nr:HIRAN domain-containing protein [Clostridia bacterium]